MRLVNGLAGGGGGCVVHVDRVPDDLLLALLLLLHKRLVKVLLDGARVTRVGGP